MGAILYVTTWPGLPRLARLVTACGTEPFQTVPPTDTSALATALANCWGCSTPGWNPDANIWQAEAEWAWLLRWKYTAPLAGIRRYFEKLARGTRLSPQLWHRFVPRWSRLRWKSTT